MQTKEIPTIRFVFDRKKIATGAHNTNGLKKGLIQVEILHHKRRKYVSTGIKVFADQWDNAKWVVNCANAVEYNRQLNHIYSNLLKELSAGIEKGFDMEQILYKSETREIEFFDYAYEALDKMEIKDGTKQMYLSLFKHIERSRLLKKQLRDVHLSDIQRFDAYLAKTDLKGTTRNVYHDKLKRIFRMAFLDGLIPLNPYDLFVKQRATCAVRRFLSEDDVKKLQSFDSFDPPKPIPGLERKGCIAMNKARDMFLFQCYTGLSYIDMSTLTRESILTEGEDCVIRRNRIKSGATYHVLLLKPALEILERNDCKLDMPINLYANYLKRIGKSIGFDFNLSSHLGRHTFATWALSKGVPIEIVSKMLGHTNIQTTQIYAIVLGQQVKNAYKELNKLFE